jgi:hypothetical protein
MTPLDAAQAIIEARARATQGVWVKTNISMRGESLLVTGPTRSLQMPTGDVDFIITASDHAAAVAQAYKDAEVKIATIRQAFAEWESIRTFRDTDTPEWAALVAALED